MRKPYSTDVSDAEWPILGPLLDRPGSRGPARTVDLREVWNGATYVLGEGCRWRSLPHEFPPHGTVCHYFHRWRRAGPLEAAKGAAFRRSATRAGCARTGAGSSDRPPSRRSAPRPPARRTRRCPSVGRRRRRTPRLPSAGTPREPQTRGELRGEGAAWAHRAFCPAIRATSAQNTDGPGVRDSDSARRWPGALSGAPGHRARLPRSVRITGGTNRLTRLPTRSHRWVEVEAPIASIGPAQSGRHRVTRPRRDVGRAVDPHHRAVDRGRDEKPGMGTERGHLLARGHEVERAVRPPHRPVAFRSLVGAARLDADHLARRPADRHARSVVRGGDRS